MPRFVAVSLLGLSVIPCTVADVFAPQSGFSPRFEIEGGCLEGVVAGVDDTFYVFGEFTGVGASSQSKIVRFREDGTPDNSFVTPRITGEVVSAAAVQADGKTVICGRFSEVDGKLRQRIARLNLDGTVDMSFDAGTVFDHAISFVAVQPDGMILVGCSSSFQLVRLQEDGQLDLSISLAGCAYDVSIQDDGKILVAGDGVGVVQSEERNLIRLNPDGSLDESYATSVGFVSDLDLDASGRAVTNGSYVDPLTAASVSPVRLNTDGSLDTSFSVGAGTNIQANVVCVQSDGRIFLAGPFSSFDGVVRKGTALLQPDGTLDTTYDPQEQFVCDIAAAVRLSSGVVVGGLSSTIKRLNAAGVLDASFPTTLREAGTVNVVERSAEGGWFVGGDFTYINGVPWVRLARVLDDGALDESFDTQDIDSLRIPTALFVQSDGKVIVGGSLWERVLRVNQDGSWDDTFNTPDGRYYSTCAITGQGYGKLVLAGSMRLYASSDGNDVWRLNADGSIDESFSCLQLSTGSVSSIVLQEDGKVVVGGPFYAWNGTPAGCILRLNNDGTIDSSFNVDGSGFNGAVKAILSHPDGGLLVWGTFGSYNSVSTPYLARLSSDGELDLEWTPPDFASPSYSGVALSPDGALWAAGSFSRGDGTSAPFLHVAAADATQTLIDVETSQDGGKNVFRGLDSERFLVAGNWIDEDSLISGGLAIYCHLSPPIVTAQPVSCVASVGDSVELCVSAVGDNLSFQWFKDGEVIEGATESVLTLENVSWRDGGCYHVRISDAYGVTCSDVVVIGGTAAAPEIVQQPRVVQAVEGSAAQIEVTVSGSGSLTFQWRRAGRDIGGATSPSLILSPATVEDVGIYELVVGDGLSVTRSGPIRVDVQPAEPAQVYRAGSSFGPKLDRAGGFASTVCALADGGYLVLGDFTGLGMANTTRVARFKADGTVDLTFVPAVIQDGIVFAAAEQSDGRLLLGGSFCHVDGETRKGIVRLNADGTLDPSFAGGAVFEFGTQKYYVHTIAVQEDGGIIVGGVFATCHGVPRSRLARLLTDGSLDETFVPPSEINGRVYAAAVLPDGKVLVGGIFEDENAARRCLLRLKSDGSLDDDFNTGSSFVAPVCDIYVLDDGRALIAFDARHYGYGSGRSQGIARLTSSGVIDESFVPGIDAAGAVLDASVFPDGRLLVGGRFVATATGDLTCLAVLGVDGELDTVLLDAASAEDGDCYVRSVFFGSDGSVVAVTDPDTTHASSVTEWRPTSLCRFGVDWTADDTFDVEPRRSGIVYAFKPAGEGKWAVAGDFSHVDGIRQGGVALLLPSGQADPEFVLGEGFDDVVLDLAVDLEGRFVVGGYFTSVSGHVANMFARINRDGTWNDGLGMREGFSHSSQTPYVDVVAVQDDGAILAHGRFLSYDGSVVPGFVRIRSDGVVDEGFNPPTTNDSFNDIYVQFDDRIMSADELYSSSTTGFGLKRFNSDGSRDGTFEVPATSAWRFYSIAAAADDTLYAGSSKKVWRVLPTGDSDEEYWRRASLNASAVRSLLVGFDESVLCGGSEPSDPEKIVERLLPTGYADEGFRVFDVDDIETAATVRAIAYGAGGSLLLAGSDFSLDGGAQAGCLVCLVPAAVPVLTVQPQNQTAEPGDDVVFSVSVSGDTPTYQWYFNGEAIDGATDATLTLSCVGVSAVGSYYVVVTNAWATVESDVVTLAGVNAPPVITAQPENVHLPVGSACSLRVEFSSARTPGLQWRRSGIPIVGATSSVLSFSALEMTDAGFYDLVITDGLSCTVSEAARVRVAPVFYPNHLQADESFDPVFEKKGATVSAVLDAPDGSVYIGGSFSRVGNVKREGLARMHSDGSLDEDFEALLESGASVMAMARQSDGRLLVGGSFTAHAGETDYINLVRLNEDGSIDTSFVPPGSINGSVYALLVQPDGRLLVGGAYYSIGSTSVVGVVRLLPDGPFDPDFATGLFTSAAVHALGLDGEGRILVGGFFYAVGAAGGTRKNLARLLQDGTLDLTFLASSSTSSYSGPENTVSWLKPMEDGRLLVGGAFRAFSVSGTSNTMAYIGRLFSDGSVDSGFASGIGASETLSSLDMQSDGKLVVVVETDVATKSTPDGSIVRLNADGTRDASFPTDLRADEVPTAIRALDGDRVMVCGPFASLAGVSAIGACCISAEGLLDEAFDGRIYSVGSVRALQPMPGGGWLVGGDFDLVDDADAGNIVLLTDEGSLDPSFAVGEGFSDMVLALALQGDGRVLVGGVFHTYEGVDVGPLVRLNSDGTRDASFEAPVPESVGYVREIKVGPTGTICVASSSSISRYDLDGALDVEFGARVTLYRSAASEPISNGKAWIGAPTISDAVNTYKIAVLLDESGQEVATATSISGISASSILSLVEMDDGRVLIGGKSMLTANHFHNVIRINSDGALDESYDLSDSFPSYANVVLLHADGVALVLGTAVKVTGSITAAGPAIQRFCEDGALDTGFVIDGFTGTGSAYAGAYQADGGILIAGTLEIDGQSRSGLTLFEPILTPAIVEPLSAPSGDVYAGTDDLVVSVSALVNGDASYQWQIRRSGGDSSEEGSDGWSDIDGATSSVLTIAVAQCYDTGDYRVIVTTSGGSTASDSVTVVVTMPPGSDARLDNLSTRALCQTGSNVLIPGFVISGTGTKRVLVRAVGPELAGFGLSNTLEDPQMVLRLQSDNSVVATNDDWGDNDNADDIVSAAARVYAFSLTEGSASSALLLDLPAGAYTAVSSGHDDESGVAIVEVYDISGESDSSRLINISTRGYVGTGDSIMIPGFIVSDEGSRTFLIRAVGPKLADYGVSGVLADPKLRIFNSAGSSILSNDNWGENGDAEDVASTASAVYAFSLEEGSADAAFVVTLPPGAYTVQASGVGNTTGVALVEVYLVE